jgi:hypothetical protein
MLDQGTGSTGHQSARNDPAVSARQDAGLRRRASFAAIVNYERLPAADLLADAALRLFAAD